MYRYRSKTRTSRTTISVMTNTAMPIVTHTDCTRACWG